MERLEDELKKERLFVSVFRILCCVYTHIRAFCAVSTPKPVHSLPRLHFDVSSFTVKVAATAFNHQHNCPCDISELDHARR
jgi:hypothetical protein